MRLWVLSHLQGSPGNRLVLEAATGAGHEARLVAPGDLALPVGAGPVRPELRGPEGPLDLPDLVFARMGGSAPAGAFDALRWLELRGVPCVNRCAALELARDKVRSFLELSQVGAPLPRTVLLGARAQVEEAVRLLGPPPWIVKLPVGTQGLGVARVDSAASLAGVVDVLRCVGQRVLVQELVREAHGVDLRVLVVGGQARAAMRRVARDEEVRSNLHRGGRAEALEVTPELARVAEAAAAALGLEVAGVDLLPATGGPVVCEVNGSPGLEGLEQATGRDLAREVVDFLEEVAAGRARRPGGRP